MHYALKSSVFLRQLRFHGWLHTETTRHISSKTKWGDDEKTALIDLINQTGKGKVNGDWDKVVRHIEQTPINHFNRWTEDDQRRLEEVVQNEFLYRYRTVDWQIVSRLLGRSATSCFQNYRKYMSGNNNGATQKTHGQNNQTVIDQATRIIDRHRRGADSQGVVTVDWHAVATETGKPMLVILGLLVRELQLKGSVPGVHIQPLQYPQMWQPSHLDRLQQLVDEHSHEMDRLNIQMVSLYMGIDQTSCARALDGLLQKKDAGIAKVPKQWSADEIQRFQKALEEVGGHKNWNQVSALVGTRSARACCSYWHRLNSLLADQKQAPMWSVDQIAKVTEMIRTKPPHTRLLPAVIKLYPDKSPEEIKLLLRKCSNRVSNVRLYRQLRQDADALVQCVNQEREANDGSVVDWRAVGKKMGAPPTLCKMHYERLSRKQNAFARWSKDEVQRLEWSVGECTRKIQGGSVDKAFVVVVDWEFVSKMVGSRSPVQCRVKHGQLSKKKIRQGEGGSGGD
ncbi:hypothetical protein GGF40_003161 [Coemansia sp. RSA 1286]|nr:hypothetical protein GGF40_003161 [Coemansia sp. RSA 1286]